MARGVRLALSIVASLGLFLSAGLGRAAAAVELDQAQDTVDELFCIQPNLGSACYHGGAQTVSAGVGGELFALEMFLARQSFTPSTRDLVVEIRADGPDGALLATSAPVPASTIPVDPEGAWILIEFPTPTTLTAGQVFAIVVPTEPMSATTDPAWGWGKSANDVYSGGVAWGGTSPSTWSPYLDGSDLAFRTYVSTGAPVCDLALAVAGSDLVDDTITAEVGAEIDVEGFDFGSNTEVTIELVPVAGDPVVTTDTTDLFGDFGGFVVFEPADIGSWSIVAYPTGDPECADGVDVTVVAAAPVPTPPPPSVPTPTPVPATADLPDTATGGTSGGGLALFGVSLLALSLGPPTWCRALARRRSAVGKR